MTMRRVESRPANPTRNPFMLFNRPLILPDNHVDSPGRMTGYTGSCGIMQFVATDAAAHRSRALDMRHRTHFGDVAVAHLALHPGANMLAVGITGSCQCGVHTHPRNRRVGL